MRRLLALVVALTIASCVRAVVLDPDSGPAPDGGAVPDVQSIDDGGPPGDAAAPDVPQD
jgi:hypothetical protein